MIMVLLFSKPSFGAEQQTFPDRRIQDLDALAKQRHFFQSRFNSKFNWHNALNVKRSLPTIIFHGSSEIFAINQIKIEGDDLLILHTPLEEGSVEMIRYSISNLKCIWDLENLKTKCHLNFEIFQNNLDKYILFFVTINGLRTISNSAQSIIGHTVNYFKTNEKLSNEDKLFEAFYQDKKSKFLDKIADYYKHYHIEFEYRHSMSNVHNISSVFQKHYDIFSYQINQEKDLEDESWINESRALFRELFTSLLAHPSLISQMDLHCLVSLIRQSMLMHYTHEKISSLIDELLLDKESYFLAYMDHLERVADSFVISEFSQIDKDQFLSNIKIENDLLFLLNQIREKRSYLEFKDCSENCQENRNSDCQPRSYFSKPYHQELESKFQRSLLRSFILLNSFIETGLEAREFLDFITEEKNSKENTRHDQDFNIYGRWGVVGHFLEKILNTLENPGASGLSHDTWIEVKKRLVDEQSIEELTAYFIARLNK